MIVAGETESGMEWRAAGGSPGALEPGEVDETKCFSGTAEILQSLIRVREVKRGNEQDERKRCRESDQFIVPEKSVKADGGKGLAQSRFGRTENQANRKDK